MRTYEQKMVLFYLAGAVIFSIVAVASSVALAMNWKLLILPSKISSTFSNIFSYILSWMFYEMWMNAKPKILTDKEIEEIFNRKK